ncbi:hypothetical protein D3C75_1155740 [compost metagenome]
MGQEAPLGVITDPAVQRAIGGAHQVDVPGFVQGFGSGLGHDGYYQRQSAQLSASAPGLKRPQAFLRLGAHLALHQW